MAAILDTGEIVPSFTPQLAMAKSQNSLVVSWSTDSVLQSALNVEGPYEDIPSAKSPYAADLTSNPRLFLR